MDGQMSNQLPRTIDEAADILISKLSLRDKSVLPIWTPIFCPDQDLYTVTGILRSARRAGKRHLAMGYGAFSAF
jgi:hypothetical protein